MLIGISAIALTTIGMLIGVAAAVLVLEKYSVAGFIMLWLSGLIDAADGTLARLTKPTALGSILDITFDRVVAVAMILALAYYNPDARFPLLVLAGTIAIAM